MAVAGWAHGARHQHAAGLAGPPVDRRHPVPGRGHRRPRRPLRGRAVGPAGQRGGPRRRRRRRAAAALAKPLQSSWRSRGDGAPSWCTGPSAAGCASPPAWTTCSRSPTPAPRTSRPAATWPGTRWPARIPPGGVLKLVKFIAYGWSSRRSDAAVRDQVEASLATAKLAGWDRLVREQRGCWTSTGTSATSRSTATTSCSRPCGSACSTSCRPACAASASRSRRRADRAGTTGTRSGTPRPTCCRCSPTRRRSRCGTRCAGGTRSSTWPATGRRCWASAGRVPVADHPR